MGLFGHLCSTSKEVFSETSSIGWAQTLVTVKPDGVHAAIDYLTKHSHSFEQQLLRAFVEQVCPIFTYW
jgi:hypothetical protein